MIRTSLSAADLEKSPEETRLRIYAWMQLARTADNRILELFRQGLIRGTVTGGQGNEWMIVPLTLIADKTVDADIDHPPRLRWPPYLGRAPLRGT